MATAAQTKAVLAYARKMGYKRGENYSAFDLPGPSFSAHRGHLGIVYHGANNGHLEFRCDGCGETIFVLPVLGDESED